MLASFRRSLEAFLQQIRSRRNHNVYCLVLLTKSLANFQVCQCGSYWNVLVTGHPLFILFLQHTVMFSLPASIIPTRKRVQFLSCQPQTTGQLHLVVVKETFARVIASRRKATTMHRNQYPSESAYGVVFEEISGTLSCHTCIAPVVAIPKNLPHDAIQCQSCKVEENIFGKIVVDDYVKEKQECWIIPVPLGHFIHLHFSNMQLTHECYQDYVRINIAGWSNAYKFCSSVSNESPITAFGNVTVTHYVSGNFLPIDTSFTLEYSIKTIECMNNSSFKCDNNSCIFEEKICDGVEDCKNGKDEIGCETGVLSIKGVPEAREEAVAWLKQKRTAAWGWRENTPRAVVALYLASAATFNGTVLEEELMAKQTELKTAVALLRPSLTNSELSMYIHALLVTCHSPRQFYGNNLVKRLKEQVEESGNFTHPLAYLALCNANESWPLKATADLNSILSSNSEYPFVKDLQAMALTALSCAANRSRNTNNVLRHTTLTLYKKTIQHFKKLQAHDGSFGNVYTTALITQALLSSGQEHNTDWNLNATIKYLMKELNSSSVDFLAIYLALPILNGKSLMNISTVNCSVNPRKHGDGEKFQFHLSKYYLCYT
ncbi:hypothetical protein AVEN_260904-1 [Araneus ventricosus]|uniref:CUB domain-containing protein n=1 Tax=Araneus ventricosus TaxID=182803 RepID=A0A4Y2HDY9_ARAVE|nr:hypothetical protein AVEN_260904-1 [Araneus ventricosus]